MSERRIRLPGLRRRTRSSDVTGLVPERIRKREVRKVQFFRTTVPVRTLRPPIGTGFVQKLGRTVRLDVPFRVAIS